MLLFIKLNLIFNNFLSVDKWTKLDKMFDDDVDARFGESSTASKNLFKQGFRVGKSLHDERYLDINYLLILSL